MQPGGLLKCGKIVTNQKRVLKKQFMLCIEDFNTLFTNDKDYKYEINNGKLEKLRK